MGTRDWYRKAFFNTLSNTEADKAYDAVAVPESRKIGKDTLFKPFSAVNFSKPHAPILFIAGEKDTIFPPALTRKIAGKYSDRQSVVDVVEFAGRSHFLCGEKGWEEIADAILVWLAKTIKTIHLLLTLHP